MVKISVVMPVYNTKEKYLRTAIESILRQSFGDYEFIILNDSPSNREIKSVMETYRDERIKYYENPETLGVARSYNRLLDLARSGICAVMNHDDIALPQRLEKQYAYLKAHPEIGLVGTGYKKFGEINRFKSVHNPAGDAEIRASLLFKSPIHHPTIMFRHDLVTAHNIRYNENFISLNDRQFCYDISRCAKLANLPEILYRYRFHKDMVSKRSKPEIFGEQCAFHEIWFKDAGMRLTEEETDIFNRYAAQGRCRIANAGILSRVAAVLDKLSAENRRQKAVPVEEFDKICARYLVKRCLNAAAYGGINSQKILSETKLPIPNCALLKICNWTLRWRKVA